MLGLYSSDIRASGNFYRNFFAALCFIAFAAALATNAPSAFVFTLCFGALSRTAVKKGWKNPAFVEKHALLIRKAK